MSKDSHECVDGTVKDGAISNCSACIGAAEDEFSALMFAGQNWYQAISSLFEGTTATASFCNDCLDGEDHCGSCPCCGSIDDAPFRWVRDAQI